MSDVFRKLYQDVTSEKFFGIRDDHPGERAYIDVDPKSAKESWLATIQNKYQKEITFTALDKCIEIPRGNGKMSKRCEGAITFESTIIFLEAKDRTGGAGTWAKDADKQLRMTIKNIEQRVDLSSFANKRAAITNRLQKTSEKHTVRIKKFLDETGYILSVDHRVVVE